MVTTIKEKYGEFSDSILKKISYGFETNKEKPFIELLIYCANLKNNYTYEKVKITMYDIVEFVYIEKYESANNTAISCRF